MSSSDLRLASKPLIAADPAPSPLTGLPILTVVGANVVH